VSFREGLRAPITRAICILSASRNDVLISSVDPRETGEKRKIGDTPVSPRILARARARARTLVVELYDDFCLISAEGGEEEEEEEEEERTAPLAARPCEGCSRVRPL